MERELTHRQRYAWMLASGLMPAIVRASNCAWQWTLLGCAMAAVYYIIVWLLSETNESLGRILIDKWGKPGKIILALAAAWTVLAASRAASGAVDAFPNGKETVLCVPVLIALCAYGAWKGSCAGARASGVLAPLLAAMLIALLLTAAGQVRLRWCQVWGELENSFGIFSSLLLPSAALFLPCKAEKRKFPVLLFAALLLLPTAVSLICTGVLGANVVAEEAVPFYTLGQSISLKGVMPRMEPLVSVLLYPAYFCAALLLVVSARTVIEQIAEKKMPVLCILLGAGIYALSFAITAIPIAFFDISAAIFWGILPLVTQFVEPAKKV